MAESVTDENSQRSHGDSFSRTDEVSYVWLKIKHLSKIVVFMKLN